MRSANFSQELVVLPPLVSACGTASSLERCRAAALTLWSLASELSWFHHCSESAKTETSLLGCPLKS